MGNARGRSPTKPAVDLRVDEEGRVVVAPYRGQALLSAPSAGSVATARTAHSTPAQIAASALVPVRAYRSLDAQSVAVTGVNGVAETHTHAAGEGYDTEITDVVAAGRVLLFF